jgi:hypothetical protein
MSVEIGNAIIGLLVLAVLLAATIPATAFLCRYRTSRKRRVSYGTLLAGASVIPLVLAVVMTCTEPDIWWSHEHKASPYDFFVMLVFLMLLCVLPALCVVVHYQRKKKRDETPVA